MREATTIDSSAQWQRPDTELIDALGGDLDRVRRVALIIVGDQHRADDLVADALTVVLPRWRSGAVSEPYAYLRRTMVNLAAKRWNRRQLAVDRDHAALDWLSNPADMAAQSVDREQALRAVATLPPRRRAIVVLRFYEDLPLSDIAELLGVRIGTVKSQLSRALAQLAKELDPGDNA